GRIQRHHDGRKHDQRAPASDSRNAGPNPSPHSCSANLHLPPRTRHSLPRRPRRRLQAHPAPRSRRIPLVRAPPPPLVQESVPHREPAQTRGDLPAPRGSPGRIRPLLRRAQAPAADLLPRLAHLPAPHPRLRARARPRLDRRPFRLRPRPEALGRRDGRGRAVRAARAGADGQAVPAGARAPRGVRPRPRGRIGRRGPVRAHLVALQQLGLARRAPVGEADQGAAGGARIRRRPAVVRSDRCGGVLLKERELLSCFVFAVF
ncbi:hypothetical protein PUNSTDRAFT_146366, partial [Punctularia strigosozonata HHB-11173 SS5]